jgi:hypothetical protein
VVVDDQHGLGHRLIVARAEYASHRGYPSASVSHRNHTMARADRAGSAAGQLEEPPPRKKPASRSGPLPNSR